MGKLSDIQISFHKRLLKEYDNLELETRNYTTLLEWRVNSPNKNEAKKRESPILKQKKIITKIENCIQLILEKTILCDCCKTRPCKNI